MQKFVGKFNKVKNKIRRNHVIESIISTLLRHQYYFVGSLLGQSSEVCFILFQSFFIGPCFLSSLPLSFRLVMQLLLGPATPPKAIRAPSLANSHSLHFYLNSLSFAKNPLFLHSKIIQLLTATVSLRFFCKSKYKQRLSQLASYMSVGTAADRQLAIGIRVRITLL